MRSIKFRVLDDSGKWQYSHLDTVNFWTFVGSGAYREETLGQFTGLLDKESKEIWEGDIVRFNNGTIQDVKYLILEGSGSSGFQMLSGALNMEVLGNVYEHPHLLGEKK